jgi:hypothetical protein
MVLSSIFRRAWHRSLRVGWLAIHEDDQMKALAPNLGALDDETACRFLV